MYPIVLYEERCGLTYPILQIFLLEFQLAFGTAALDLPIFPLPLTIIIYELAYEIIYLQLCEI